MSRLTALIVDDEPLARDTLADLLGEDPEIEVIGAYGDGHRALERIRSHRPDIVFLDIEMPGPGGLEVVAELAPQELPAIVFVTAHGEHALRAFDLEALDYVLKPFSDQRFFEALERAKRRVREKQIRGLADTMSSLSSRVTHQPRSTPTENGGKLHYLERLPVKSGQRSLIIKADEIQWIESEDYYVRLHTGRGNHLLRASLASLEARLDPQRFIRVHRTAIVHLDAVTEVQRLFRGVRAVVLSDGARLRISRSRLKQVEARLLPRVG